MHEELESLAGKLQHACVVVKPGRSFLCRLFEAHLYREGLVASTVKSYLAAVRHAQIALGLGDPKMAGMPQLEYVTKGLCKKMAGRQK